MKVDKIEKKMYPLEFLTLFLGAMDKPKRWQVLAIVIALLLTVYNILPTIFYYTKPLDQPIDAKRGARIAEEISLRVNSLEDESVSWLHSFCKLIGAHPEKIAIEKSAPDRIHVTFSNLDDAKKLAHFLPRAGALIPFVPAQLSLMQTAEEQFSKTVVVKRGIPLHLNAKTLYEFGEKRDANGKITPVYQTLISDRLYALSAVLGGPSEQGELVSAFLKNPEPGSGEILYNVCSDLLSFVDAFGETSAVTKRYYASFTQIDTPDKTAFIDGFLQAITSLKDRTKLERMEIEEAIKKQGDEAKEKNLSLLNQRETQLAKAEGIVRKYKAYFSKGKTPLTFSKIEKSSNGEKVDLSDYNIFVASAALMPQSDKIAIELKEDLLPLLEQGSAKRELREKFLYREMASLGQQSGEEVLPTGNSSFEIPLSNLAGSKSFLTMKLAPIAAAVAEQTKNSLEREWLPTHIDLQRENFPIVTTEEYQNLPAQRRAFALVLYSPATASKNPPKGFRTNSVYVIAKGFGKILDKLRKDEHSPYAEQFIKDFNQLRDLLQSEGYYGYPAAAANFGPALADDFIFEAQDFYHNVIGATREKFVVSGTKRFAVLEFSNVEERILTLNKIENEIHEELLKWRDDYNAAKAGIRGLRPTDVPQPTSSPLWSNLSLSTRKYFNGDERKVLHWGLDLSGGKTVQIELRDANNKPVTNETEVKQAINELYKRVNKMGVSEVTIRQEGETITLDFPGTQALSAEELIKASTMYFHVVNEKFSYRNSALQPYIATFLQDVWSEAVVTGKKDPEAINAIAYRHLYGESLDSEVASPRSEAARTLFDQGLRLAPPAEKGISNLFDETYSQIAVLRGNEATDWHGQTNPLIFVFRNYALEGSNLEDIRAGFDPQKGNYLAFNVKKSEVTPTGQKIHPAEDFHIWASEFSKEGIAGTELEKYAPHSGYRMAVILNGTVISAPTLDASIKDSAMITGSFTQREIAKLEADLKAGSLSFTPRILSEKNVSPDLGEQERAQGIFATGLALLLVIFTMVGYYRFAGIIASTAVILNLFIMWGVLQNLQATLSLAGIAGVILTLGMAVDANVLVFERIREEFEARGRIGAAIAIGYKRAFSAIVDSNLTTLLAGVILLNFDSGPIKGFAITLIIGIISSMFTALFMTRIFFAKWAQNPKHQALKMFQLIRSKSFNFLKWGKLSFILSLVIIAAGAYFLSTQKSEILGMDFKGGFALTVEVKPQENSDYRKLVEGALSRHGIASNEMQVRELTPSNVLRIFLSRSLEIEGRPFHDMPLSVAISNPRYSYETNPRIDWIVHAFAAAGVPLTDHSLQHLDKDWTVISGQMSDTMRNNAFIGLGIALFMILLYITIRFEFKYAIAATLSLAHDVLITIALIAILFASKVSIQIDMNTVAALLTIIGYSLNDTIIVFDRVREDVKKMGKASFKDVINHALNVTLSRTLLTSGTTLFALIPLVILGGSTIFGFALVMILGVILGTLSSLFIAAPLLLIFDRREKGKKSALPSTSA